MLRVVTVSEEEPIKGPVLPEPIRQPYRWPRGPLVREPGDAAARNLAILACIAVAAVLVAMLYFMSQGRMP